MPNKKINANNTIITSHRNQILCLARNKSNVSFLYSLIRLTSSSMISDANKISISADSRPSVSSVPSVSAHKFGFVNTLWMHPNALFNDSDRKKTNPNKVSAYVTAVCPALQLNALVFTPAFFRSFLRSPSVIVPTI